MNSGRLCSCGQQGCAEAYASGSNTARRMMEKLNSVSSITNNNTVDAKEVFRRAYEENDPISIETIQEVRLNNYTII